MRIKKVLFALTIILSSQIFAAAQTPELAQLLEETQAVARKTAYQAWVEYTSDFKVMEEKPNGKKFINAYESLCSRKTCVSIPITKNNKPVSENKIYKYRREAAAKLIKAEKRADHPNYGEKENSLGYGITIYDWFNPGLYLKACKSTQIEKSNVNGRTTVKIGVANCNVESLSKSAKTSWLQFMTKTEGFVWIDEQDKAIVKMEIYAGKEYPNLSKTNEPLVVIEAGKIPDGFWFWKSLTVRALDNKAIFPQYPGNFEYAFYNYRLSSVEVNSSR